MPHPDDLPEVDHDDRLHIARMEITPLMVGLFDILHDAVPIEPGQQWTIPMGSSCGFRSELILRVAERGDCQRNPNAFSEEARKERFERFIDLFMQHYGIDLGGSDDSR